MKFVVGAAGLRLLDVATRRFIPGRTRINVRFATDFDRQVWIEHRVFVHSALGIAAWIADDARPVQNVVEAVMGMTVNPQARATLAQEVLGIGNEAGVEQRVGEPWVDAPARRSVMGDDDRRAVMGRVEPVIEPGRVALEKRR